MSASEVYVLPIKPNHWIEEIASCKSVMLHYTQNRAKSANKKHGCTLLRDDKYPCGKDVIIRLYSVTVVLQYI